MNLDLLFLSNLNMYNQELQDLFNIPVLISHILLLMACTMEHKEPSNTRNQANVQTAFPSRGLSLSQHGALPLSDVKRLSQADFPADAAAFLHSRSAISILLFSHMDFTNGSYEFGTT